ncbi:HAMP domain-containing histidine kinase [Sphingomonas sp. CGMCC 1.13654]|uniref:histidine kinase n=1 Tax=Sphingomonas chungangi TaxID=2683589 RepID=A0A838L3F2_9SPHN|nr:HAMP domain-containing sensor histidine kinase [Sphingomonas chungangi]MBA2933587.1 HAMP domain-containing histidine kinase [Sphingomonas chungangi]MVW54920.1 sensor histidine kinase [Sphingomonas chungangi]
MIAIGVIGFGLADHWVSSRIDQSLTYHADKYVAKVEGDPSAEMHLQAAILEWQHRKVLSERTYILFDRNDRRIAGRLDIRPPPAGFSYVHFTGGGRHVEEGRALAKRLPRGGLFVVVQHSEAAEGLHAILPWAVLAICLVALVLGVSATFLFAKLTAERLSETQHIAAAIAAGDLSRRIPMDRLDGMFAEQGESLNQMLDHMEELVRAQQLFSSNLAHDLRTPLMRLRSLLETASRDDQVTFPSLLERAERECTSIINIFDALLRLAEIETGQHPTAMAQVSLRPLLEDIADTMEPVINDCGGTLAVRQLDDVTITGDPDLINQLMINLIENVATHTPRGTNVTLALESGESGAMITVCDDGPGLATGDFVRITKPFERGSAASARTGSGLGLAIASAIARFHRGSLELVDASPGLEVRVRIPANDDQNASVRGGMPRAS